MFIDWKMLSIRFLTGVLLGIATVQVLAHEPLFPMDPDYLDHLGIPPTSYSNDNTPRGYKKLYPDVEVIDYGNGVTETYNWDTNKYQDVEIIHDYGHEVEVYNYDTGEYQIIDTCC